jgi:PAS domain S-box-containing protein
MGHIQIIIDRIKRELVDEEKTYLPAIMNLIFISDNPQETDLVRQELSRHAPPIDLDVVADVRAALNHINTSGQACDFVLLDTTVSNADAASLAAALRNEKKPITIAVLVEAAERERLADLLKAGLDRYIPKREGYAARLGDALQQAKEIRKSTPASGKRPMRLLFAGNSEEAKHHLSGMPNILLEAITPASDGTLQLPDIKASPADLIIIDVAVTGIQTLKAIKDVISQAPDTPLIILTNPGDEDTAIQAMQAGAADCIPKTETFFLRLLPAIERELRRREQARERAFLKSREERLRQIVEIMPAGIAIIAPEGTFLAINRAGLSLMGATRIEQVLGKNFLHLLPADESEQIRSLLTTISGWNSASARLNWKGLDGSIPGIEIRAIPMRREGVGAATALASLSPLAGSQGVAGEIQQKCVELANALQESEARFRDLLDKHNLQQTQLESALQQAESRCLAAEERQTRLEGIAEESAARLKLQIEEQSAERAHWEQSRQAFKDQCAKIETVAQSLRSAQASLAETYGTEQEQWKLQIQELQQQLEASEIRFNQLSEAPRTELAQMDLIRQELEQRCRDAEAQRNDLQNELTEAQSRLLHLTEGYGAEHSQSTAARLELERKCQNAEEQKNTLQNALNDVESQIAHLAEKYKEELSQRDLAQKELETKNQAAEEQQLALQHSLRDAESNSAQLIENHNLELSQYEFAQKKAEQKYQASEMQRLAMQSDLHQAEGKVAQLEEHYGAERTRWNSEKAELEQRFQTAEKEHAAALQNAARETESRLAWIAEQNQSKAMQLEKIQSTAEQLEADCKRLTIESADYRNRYQRLSQFTSAGILLAKRNGLVLECNDLAARMFGYVGPEDALAQTGENRFQIYAFEGALDARLQQDGKLENIVWASLGRDGRLIRIQECATLIETSGAEGPLVERILIDISEIRKIDEGKWHAHQLEQAGDLAAATIKSFKDLCTSLAHTGELLMNAPDDGNAVRRIADALLNDAKRGAKHAGQFLSAAQKAERTPALLNLNEILLNNDVLLHCMAGDDIEIQTSLAQRIGLISADRNKMVQLIGNLLANARETLPLGGTVTIETFNVEVASPVSGIPAGLPPGIYICMVFSADGCALQPERRNTSIRAIVERMGGRMETINDPRLGNSHKVYLPRVEPFAGQIDQLLPKTAQLWENISNKSGNR